MWLVDKGVGMGRTFMIFYGVYLFDVVFCIFLKIIEIKEVFQKEKCILQVGMVMIRLVKIVLFLKNNQDLLLYVLNKWFLSIKF